MTPELPETLRVVARVADVLTALGVRFHLGGSFASAVHGIPRQTHDVDLVVELTPAQAGQLVERLAAEFYGDEDAARRAVERHGSFNLVDLGSGMKVDLFQCGPGAFDRSELERAQAIDLGGGWMLPVKSVEDTILRKLDWYRRGIEASERQWSDVVGIVRIQRDRLDHGYLDRWAAVLGVADLLARALAA